MTLAVEEVETVANGDTDAVKVEVIVADTVTLTVEEVETVVDGDTNAVNVGVTETVVDDVEVTFPEVL